MLISQKNPVAVARRRKGWTQKRLVAEASIGIVTLQRIEARDHYPHPLIRQALARVLEADVDVLFPEATTPPVPRVPRYRKVAAA